MQLTMQQIADTWLAAGGNRNRAVEFTAICIGESSGNTEAISSAGAQGLWQIMPEHWASLGLPADQWASPIVNGRAAVMLSGHGTNCAAWDSAYADIEASGRYSYLDWPERGSADYEHMLTVAVVLGHDKLGGAAPKGGFRPSVSAEHAIAHLNGLATKLFPAIVKIEVAQRMAVNRMFTPGWRP